MDGWRSPPAPQSAGRPKHPIEALIPGLFREQIVKKRRSGRWPVEVFVGLGFPIEIATILSAFQFLNEWPGSRGIYHQRAIDACRASLAGTGDDTQARKAFIEFARDRDILAPEALATTARKFAEEWMGRP
jgi:hypothetical protein